MAVIVMLVLAGFLIVDVLVERLLHPRNPRSFNKEDSHRRLMQELRRHGNC